MNYENRREFALDLDKRDSLARFRDQFNFPRKRNGHEPVYLCGNSLGLQPELAAQFVREELDNWAHYAVDGHFNTDRPWISFHRRATQGFAQLTGAKPSEVVAMNTLTVNLHLLMASFYRPSASRYKIVIESDAFPSDRYAAMSQLRMQGFDPDTDLIEWSPRGGASELHVDDLANILERQNGSVALLLLPGVQYYTGQVLDMPAICNLGREAGCAVGLDLAHAIGNVELALHDWAPDFAAWCTYKYLNAGPGAIAGAFIHDKHCSTGNLEQLHGWWGHDEATRFKMRRSFTPAKGAELWQLSNPPILSLAPVIASLEIFGAAGMPDLVAKSKRMTGFLAWLIDERFRGRIESITPAEDRGCQISLVVRDKSIDAAALFDRLGALNVTTDWREPDVIRVAPVPLYNSYSDVFEFAERLQQALTAI